jgi:head-tail adaptor|nr:MAG TPA: putative head-tail adaptor [Caudoviricetes sp.]
MNYNKSIKVYSITRSKDGYGGYTDKYNSYGKISCSVAPYTEYKIDANGREITHHAIKVFSRSKIAIDDFIFEYDNQKYKRISVTDYGKVIRYVMELM